MDRKNALSLDLRVQEFMNMLQNVENRSSKPLPSGTEIKQDECTETMITLPNNISSEQNQSSANEPHHKFSLTREFSKNSRKLDCIGEASQSKRPRFHETQSQQKFPFAKTNENLTRFQLSCIAPGTSNASEKVQSTQYFLSKEKLLNFPLKKENHLTIVSTTLWIGNLPPATTSHELRSLFIEFGEIKQLYIKKGAFCAYIWLQDRATAVKVFLTLKKSPKKFYQDVKVGFAPGHGMKDYEFKDYWDKQIGCFNIPHSMLENKLICLELMAEGGQIAKETVPDWLQPQLATLEKNSKCVTVSKEEKKKRQEKVQELHDLQVNHLCNVAIFEDNFSGILKDFNEVMQSRTASPCDFKNTSSLTLVNALESYTEKLLGLFTKQQVKLGNLIAVLKELNKGLLQMQQVGKSDEDN